MIDAIVCWPRFADYPRWRQFIRDERERFGKVFVVFTEHDGPDMSGWVRANFPEATFIDSPERGSRDWRTVAVNAALDASTAEHVWFTEQDFIVTDPALFDYADKLAGIPEDGNRIVHPACIFAPRALIERTSRDFGPERRDHFGRFAEELAALEPIRLIAHGYRHMQATSEALYLIGQGEQPRFHPEAFRGWLADQLTASVPIEPAWEARARAVLA